MQRVIGCVKNFLKVLVLNLTAVRR